MWQAHLVNTNESVVVKVVWPDEDLDPNDVAENGQVCNLKAPGTFALYC